MLNRAGFAIATLATALAYDTVVSQVNARKFKRLQARNVVLATTLETTTTALTAVTESHAKYLKELILVRHQLAYVSQLMDEHEVPVTEFDIIAMHTVL